MQNFGTQYLFVSAALIAACVAFWLSPGTAPDPQNGVDYSFLINLRPLGLVGAVSILMHVLCNSLGLRTITKWIVSILVPSFATLAGWFWWVGGIRETGEYYPTTDVLITVLISQMTLYTIGFAVITAMFSMASWLLIRYTTKNNRSAA